MTMGIVMAAAGGVVLAAGFVAALAAGVLLLGAALFLAGIVAVGIGGGLKTGWEVFKALLP